MSTIHKLDDSYHCVLSFVQGALVESIKCLVRKSWLDRGSYIASCAGLIIVMSLGLGHVNGSQRKSGWLNCVVAVHAWIWRAIVRSTVIHPAR